jgi:phosphoglycolate phosphatase-like HAD superfamily hydrolase
MPIAARCKLPRGIAAVLFDFDDTLIDSYGARVASLDVVLRHAGVASPTAEEFIASLAGRQLNTALDELEARLGGNLGLFALYRRTYWLHKPQPVTLYPGMLYVLRELRRRGVALGIVTTKGRAFELEGRKVGAEAEMREAGIDGLFAAVIGFEDIANHKPHPEGVLLALERLGVPPGEALFVGDSAADMGAARSAGCRACLATWGAREGVAVPAKADVDMIASEPQQLLRLAFKTRAGG